MTETLIAIAMIGTAVLVMGSIIDGAVKITAWSRSQLIADGLITEAIEGVKNLRDTKLLQKSKDAFAGANTSYTVERNTLNQWSLSHQSPNALDLENNVTGDYLLYVDDVEGYNHHSTGVPSIFYRGVNFTEVSAEKVEFEVSVQWYEGTKIRFLDREMTLYNY